MGGHRYCSNWAVAESRYDVLLGMPWHVHCNPKVDYTSREVVVADEILPLDSAVQKSVSISNIGVKKFRSLLRKKGHQKDFEVYQLVPKDSTRYSKSPMSGMTERRKTGGKKTSKLDRLLSKYDSVFQEELPWPSSYTLGGPRD